MNKMDYRDEFRQLESDAKWSLPLILTIACVFVALVAGAAYLFGWFDTATVKPLPAPTETVNQF